MLQNRFTGLIPPSLISKSLVAFDDRIQSFGPFFGPPPKTPKEHCFQEAEIPVLKLAF
jgi:hypothetical protein